MKIMSLIFSVSDADEGGAAVVAAIDPGAVTVVVVVVVDKFWCISICCELFNFIFNSHTARSVSGRVESSRVVSGACNFFSMGVKYICKK